MRLRLQVVTSPALAPRALRARNPRAVLYWFLALALFAHIAALAAIDVTYPYIGDPEYGLRLSQLRKRSAEHPDRRLVLVVGSSRAAMGVKPDAWEATRPGTPNDPLLFNLSHVGSGPIQQLITVNRLYADGVSPSAVLIEYWPPTLRQDGSNAEEERVGHRLRPGDRRVVRSYFNDPEKAEHRVLSARLSPLYANRDKWTVRVLPRVLTPNRHADVPWRDLDGWGWLPGMVVRLEDEATRRRFLDHHRPTYCDMLTGNTIHPNSDRALREIVSVVRSHGGRVGFLYMPESREFQSWYPPEVETAVQTHLRSLSRELSVPVFDMRNVMDDRYLADGFHLSRIGAAAFTEKLGPTVTVTFP